VLPGPPRYLVTRPHPGSGVGSNLASLAGTIWLAEKTGRTAVVDWRGSAFLKDPSANYFAEFFETPSTLQGVPVLYAPDPAVTGLIDAAPIIGVSVARAAAQHGSDEPALVLRDYHGLERLNPGGPPSANFWRLKDFYRFITPRDFVRREIEQFADAHFRNAFTIGVNLSSGNGEFERGQHYQGRVDTAIFSKDAVFLRKVERARRLAVRHLPRALRAEARIFFATDAYAMHRLLARLPNAVTRRTTFPPPGVGRVFCDYREAGYTDRDAIVDAIVDMFLLARCHALIRNGSVFNEYANTVTTCFNGNVRHIETLYARYWWRAAWSRARRIAGR
jgi:hypothetical protein